MSALRFRNALLYDGKARCFREGGFTVEGGRFAELREYDNAVDLGGAPVLPGLIDLHTHGRGGFDFLTADVAQMREMKRQYAAKGVTTVVPTLASGRLTEMLDAVSRVKEAGFRAVHIEGRYLNPARRGAHHPALLAPLSAEEIPLFAERAGGMKLHFTAAFELDGDGRFLSALLSCGATASLGHSDADYETASRLAEQGVRSFTHLFNTMPPLHHRAGGAAAAGLLSDAYTEIICDGFHLAPETVALIGRIKSPDRVILVTDSMEGTGCPDGEYFIAGNPVRLSGGRAYTEEGAIAGSTLELLDAIGNYASFRGIPFAGAVPCATANPAALLGLSDVGSIAPGKRADFLVLNKDFSLRQVCCGGKELERESDTEPLF